MEPSQTVSDSNLNKPTFREAFFFWLKLGFISFGGPASQISIMHQELVERKKWISDQNFLVGLNFCMLLPGPEAQQLATYCGWCLHRLWGGIVAGLFFILPAAILLWGLSVVYVYYGRLAVVDAFFFGLKPAVVAIVLHATWRVGHRVLKGWLPLAIAAGAFIASAFLKVSFPSILLAAAFIGLLSHWIGKKDRKDDVPQKNECIDWRQSLRVLLGGCAIWWLPILVCGTILGWTHILSLLGVFYSKIALITFGGAYAILPHVAQEMVSHYSWIDADQMITGLALAETTPGPLIMVLQFYGFMAAWDAPFTSQPLWSATLGAVMATWATFVPSFTLILAGAPFVRALQGIKSLSSILTAITSAVVGIILNLGYWLGMKVFISAEGSVDIKAVVLGVLFTIVLFRFKVGIIWIVLASGLLGLLIKWPF